MKMCRLYWAALSSALLCAPLQAGPTASQGSSVLEPEPAKRSNRAMSDGDKARLLTSDFATCIVKRTPAQVERALALPNDESDKAISKLIDARCLFSGGLQIPSQLMRGALYRALYVRKFKNEAPWNSALKTSFDPSANTTGNKFATDTEKLLNFGNCVAISNPLETRKLVLTKVASPDEAEALEALGQNFADCLPGGTVRFSRGVLQGLLAEVLYRASLAPKSAKSGSM